MKRSTGGYIVAILGILLIAAGLVVKFAIMPTQAQWPSSVDKTREYEGTLAVMLNPAALATMDMANLFLTNVPVTISRHITTDKADVKGAKALVHEVATMAAPGGTVLQTTDKWYAIDRKTMEHIANFSTNTNVQDQRQGLVVGFPIGTEKITYKGWNDDYQQAVDVVFVAEEDRAGVKAYHFEATSGPQKIMDPTLLAIFPPAIPKALLAQLVPVLAPQLAGQFGQLAAALPDPVPFSYTYEYTTEYWVEPASGVIVDYEKVEKRTAVLESSLVPGGALPVGSVFDLTYKQTADSVTAAVKDANDAKSKLNLFGMIVPYAAVGAGALLLLGGGFMAMRKKTA
jgi:hypothetical protein